MMEPARFGKVLEGIIFNSAGRNHQLYPVNAPRNVFYWKMPPPDFATTLVVARLIYIVMLQLIGGKRRVLRGSPDYCAPKRYGFLNFNDPLSILKTSIPIPLNLFSLLTTFNHFLI
jgi:hypothetical protein